jgi:transposase-like protein
MEGGRARTSESADGGLTSIVLSINRELTVDFLLSVQREIAAAKPFFIRELKQHGVPQKINVEGHMAIHTAISELKAQNILPQNMKVRVSKYLNNLIEQEHRRVKQGIYPRLG